MEDFLILCLCGAAWCVCLRTISYALLALVGLLLIIAV